MYTRRDCSLCDAAKAAMRASGVDFRIEEIDIDNDPELRRRYSDDVPVVCIGGARPVTAPRADPTLVRTGNRRGCSLDPAHSPLSVTSEVVER